MSSYLMDKKIDCIFQYGICRLLNSSGIHTICELMHADEVFLCGIAGVGEKVISSIYETVKINGLEFIRAESEAERALFLAKMKINRHRDFIEELRRMVLFSIEENQVIRKSCYQNIDWSCN